MKEGISDFSNRLPNERKNHSVTFQLRGTFIYIPSQRQENIFPSSIRFPSTSNRMELERSLVHSTLEKWNKIFEKCRFLLRDSGIVYYREKSRRSTIFPRSRPILCHLTNIHRYLASLFRETR